MTITLGWWIIPFAFFIISIVFIIKMDRAEGGGFLAGMWEGVIAIGCFFIALVSLITGLLK